MVFIYCYLGAMVALMIYAIVVLIKDMKERKSYDTEIGYKVSNKEWRAHKKQIKTDEKQQGGKGNKRGKATPIKTKILDHGAGKITGGGGGVGRAIVGGAIAGSAGAVVGANTRKQKFTQEQYTMFKVWYSNGQSEIEKVLHTSAKYKQYLELLEE